MGKISKWIELLFETTVSYKEHREVVDQFTEGQTVEHIVGGLKF